MICFNAPFKPVTILTLQMRGLSPGKVNVLVRVFITVKRHYDYGNF